MVVAGIPPQLSFRACLIVSVDSEHYGASGLFPMDRLKIRIGGRGWKDSAWG